MIGLALQIAGVTSYLVTSLLLLVIFVAFVYLLILRADQERESRA